MAEDIGTLAAPPGLHFVPGERVLLLTVAMPDMPGAQRRGAVAFAVEDRIARPLEEVHVILGPALPDGGGWLVAVIARDALAAIPAARGVRLLPDVLMLPVPVAEEWSVWAGGGRVLVRTPDGAGFSTTAALLPAFHAAGGAPGVVLYGGTLDPSLPVLRSEALPARPDRMLDRFDLSAARPSERGGGLPRGWRRMAAVLACAGLGHLGLLMADVFALGHVRDASEAQLREALRATGQPSDGALDAAIGAALARASGTGSPRLIPLMARAFAALGPLAGRIGTSDLRYGADQQSLTLTLQAPDIATLQAAESSLAAAGFRVTAGAATTGDGTAEQQLTLQEAGA